MNLEVFDTVWGGKGLRTLQPIKKGQFIIEYVGEVITVAESKVRFDEDRKLGITDFYQISLGKGCFITRKQYLKPLYLFFDVLKNLFYIWLVTRILRNHNFCFTKIFKFTFLFLLHEEWI